MFCCPDNALRTSDPIAKMSARLGMSIWSIKPAMNTTEIGLPRSGLKERLARIVLRTPPGRTTQGVQSDAFPLKERKMRLERNAV
jgi:hypothetical protein